MTTVNTEITKETVERKYTLEEMISGHYKDLEPDFMAARIDFIYKHDEVSTDLKSTINYIIDETANNTGISFSDPDTIRYYFPVIVKNLRENRGDDEAFDFLYNLNQLFWTTPKFNHADFQKHEIARLSEESFIFRILSLAVSEAESCPAFSQGLVDLVAEHYPNYRTTEQRRVFEFLTGFTPAEQDNVTAIKPRTSKLPKAA